MYNNYGYNPYQNRFIGLPQMEQQSPAMNGLRPVISGKIVDSIDVVKAMDITLDGSTHYFPLIDGSAIVTKQLGLDGVSKITVYKPVEETKKEEPKYVTVEEFDKFKEELKKDE